MNPATTSSNPQTSKLRRCEQHWVVVLALRDAIAYTRNFHGVTGDITLDANRDPIKPAIILQYRQGQYVFRERVVPTAAD